MATGIQLFNWHFEMVAEPSLLGYKSLTFFFFLIVCIYFMGMGVWSVCLFTMSVRDAHRVQKRVSGLLGLEIKRVVCCHMGSGNQTQVVWESGQCS